MNDKRSIKSKSTKQLIFNNSFMEYLYKYIPNTDQRCIRNDLNTLQFTSFSEDESNSTLHSIFPGIKDLFLMLAM